MRDGIDTANIQNMDNVATGQQQGRNAVEKDIAAGRRHGRHGTEKLMLVGHWLNLDNVKKDKVYTSMDTAMHFATTPPVTILQQRAAERHF